MPIARRRPNTLLAWGASASLLFAAASCTVGEPATLLDDPSGATPGAAISIGREDRRDFATGGARDRTSLEVRVGGASGFDVGTDASTDAEAGSTP